VVSKPPRPSRRLGRGFTVLETIVALAVVTITVAVALDSGRLPAVAATKSLNRLQATRAAASALERLDRHTLAAGKNSFDPRMPGADGHLVIKELRPLLFDVTASVRLPDGTTISTTTRMVAEGDR
jgi:type II secretory pathway pseudopilin PulG